MAFNFSGEFTVDRAPDAVFDFLTDPQRFAPLLPDFQSVTVQDPTHFVVKLNVGISHIRGTAEVKMELAQSERPSRAQYKGQGTMAGGNMSMTAGFELTPDGAGTRVAWKSEAQVFGRIISMAGGLLEPLARKNIQQVIDALKNALNAGIPVRGH
jgi:carbon monoxide dehydrogenase subunit G